MQNFCWLSLSKKNHNFINSHFLRWKVEEMCRGRMVQKRKKRETQTNDPWRLGIEVTHQTDLNVHSGIEEIWECFQISQLASVLSADWLSPNIETLSNVQIFLLKPSSLWLSLSKIETFIKHQVPHFQPGIYIEASHWSVVPTVGWSPLGRCRLSVVSCQDNSLPQGEIWVEKQQSSPVQRRSATSKRDVQWASEQGGVASALEVASFPFSVQAREWQGMCLKI